MVKIENDCCGCATGSYPCLGNSCPLRHREHYYCDECGEEDKLYEYDGRELCIDCIEKSLTVVGGGW